MSVFLTNPYIYSVIDKHSSACHLMFGDVKLKVHSVYSFNVKRTELYRSPNWDPDTKDGAIFVIDSSHSMIHSQNQVKMVVSAAKAMADARGAFNIPEPMNATALLDTLDEIMSLQIPGVSRIIIVSDGDDTASIKKKVISHISDDNVPNYVDFPLYPRYKNWLKDQDIMLITGEYKDHAQVMRPDEYLTRKYKLFATEQKNRRREAVAKHLSNLNVELFIVGVNNERGEVKDFIKMCSSSKFKIRTALVEHNATPEAVTAVMKTMVRRSNESNRNQPIETINSGNAQQASVEEVSLVSNEVRRTSSARERKADETLHTDGPPFNTDQEMEYVKYIIEGTCKKREHTPEETATATCIIWWFRSIVLRENTPIGSALIGGRMWPQPNGKTRGPVFIVTNKMTTTLTTILKYLSREPHWIYKKINGLEERFREQIAGNAIGPLFLDAGKISSHLFITGASIPQLRKRTEADNDAVLYYNFKEANYNHYSANHRAGQISNPDIQDALASIKITWKGNSGERHYPGTAAVPVLDSPPAAVTQSPIEDVPKDDTSIATSHTDLPVATCFPVAVPNIGFNAPPLFVQGGPQSGVPMQNGLSIGGIPNQNGSLPIGLNGLNGLNFGLNGINGFTPVLVPSHFFATPNGSPHGLPVGYNGLPIGFHTGFQNTVGVGLPIVTSSPPPATSSDPVPNERSATSTSAEQSNTPKRRGRPPGSKNKEKKMPKKD